MEGATMTGAMDRSESAFGVIGSFLGIVGTVGAAVLLSWLAFVFVRRDSSESRTGAPVFRDGRAPAGFVLVEEKGFPFGDRLMRWSRSEDGLDLIVLDVPSRAKASQVFEGGKTSSGFGPPEQDDDQARLEKWEREKDFAWHATIRSDRMEWGAWSVPYRIERSFRDDGTWRDAIRVDLSREGTYRVLFLVFPEGIPGTEEQLLEICRALDLASTSDA